MIRWTSPTRAAYLPLAALCFACGPGTETETTSETTSEAPASSGASTAQTTSEDTTAATTVNASSTTSTLSGGTQSTQTSVTTSTSMTTTTTTTATTTTTTDSTVDPSTSTSGCGSDGICPWWCDDATATLYDYIDEHSSCVVDDDCVAIDTICELSAPGCCVVYLNTEASAESLEFYIDNYQYSCFYPCDADGCGCGDEPPPPACSDGVCGPGAP